MSELQDDIPRNDGPVLQQDTHKQVLNIIIYSGCCALYLYATIGIIMLAITTFGTYAKAPPYPLLSALDVVNYAGNNLGTPPISKIIAVDAKKSCPAGYTLMQLAQWPGTQAGCYCPHRNLLKRRNCGIFEIFFKSCKNVHPTPEMTISNWEGSIFCSQRIQNYTSSNDTCPKGYVSCTGNICVPKNTPCPATDIMIVSSKNQNYNDIEEDEKEGFITSVMKNGKLFMTTSNNKELPIYGMEITISSLSCLRASSVPSSLNQSGYILSNNLMTDCGPFGSDPNSIVISYENETDLFQSNGLTSGLDSLPFFNRLINNNTAYLSARFRLKLNPVDACFGYNYDEFSDLGDKMDSMYNSIEITSSLTLTLLMILILFGLNYTFLFITYHQKDMIPKVLIESWIPFIFCSIITITLMIGLIIIHYYKNSLILCQNIANNIYNNQCFDNIYVTEAFGLLGNGLPKQIYSYIFLLKFFMWYSFIMTLILLLIVLIIKYKLHILFMNIIQT